jgi:hypothetical protein
MQVNSQIGRASGELKAPNSPMTALPHNRVRIKERTKTRTGRGKRAIRATTHRRAPPDDVLQLIAYLRGAIVPLFFPNARSVPALSLSALRVTSSAS